MNTISLYFELNDDEKNQIKELAEKARKKVKQDSANGQIASYYSEEKEILEIHAKAHERAFNYYSTHLNELPEALKQEIKLNAIFIAAMEEGEAEKELKLETYIKENLKKDIAPYLDILKNNAKKDYEEIVSFIDYAIEHKGEIYEEEREAIKDNKKKFLNPKIPQKLAGYFLAATTFNYERHGTLQSELYKLTLRKKKKKELDPILDIMKITEKNFILFLSNFSKIKWLRQSALQLLDIIVITFTENGAEETEVNIPLKIYMEMRGLKDEKEARKQIKEDLEALYNLKFETFTQPIHRKSQDFINLAIIGSHGIENGKIFASLDGVFSKLLSYYPAIPIHKGLLKLKANKNPCAYYFAKKIHEHKFMNSGKKNEDIIAVMTLLEAAQNVLPTYEEVFNSNRHYKERIIDPFERDMDALIEIGMLNEWTYCHKNEIPLTDTELENLDYETFKTLNIKVQWTEYPNQSNRLEIKAKKIKAAIKKKEKRELRKAKDN